MSNDGSVVRVDGRASPGDFQLVKFIDDLFGSILLVDLLMLHLSDWCMDGPEVV